VRLCALVLLVTTAAFSFAACGSGSGSPPAGTPDASVGTRTATAAPEPKLTLVAHHDLGGEGGADVWANGEVAYVGARCFSGGVKIVDVSDPANPQLAARAADHDNTSAEDVMVIDARTRFFEGELMAVGLQDCPSEGGKSGLQGLELWDVSDPAQPERLGFLDVGPLPFGGVHELYLLQREERVLALLAVPFSEVFHPAGLGDLRIVEVTDPRNPVELADWGAGKDGGLAFGTPSLEELASEEFALQEFPPRTDCTPPPQGGESLCRGDMAWVIGHSASANEEGNRAYVSYWDAGMIILDISEPSRPLLLGRAEEPATEEGNLHSAIAVPGEELAITTDEDFVHTKEDGIHGGPSGGTGLPGGTPHPAGTEPRPGDRWGFARVWDISNPEQPKEIGSFETRHSASSRTDGLFTVHNPEVHGDLLYLSWYSDGLRVLDISEPESPREIASFVPEPEESYGGESIPSLVWGVHVEGDLVFLSDMAAGLYILEIAPGG
jgi:hypothetical protein